MRVLIACEESGVVRDAFTARGHDAWSCDLKPSQRNGQHIQEDALKVAYREYWDLMIAHPPCTYLCNSGVRWLMDNVDRWKLMHEAGRFFKALLDAPIEKKALENPVAHIYARDIIGTHSQVIQPYRFGHPESKATCLWLRGLPPLRCHRDVKAVMQTLPKNEQQRIFHMAPGPERSALRSVTFEGIAYAMAEQWGTVSPDSSRRALASTKRVGGN